MEGVPVTAWVSLGNDLDATSDEPDGGAGAVTVVFDLLDRDIPVDTGGLTVERADFSADDLRADTCWSAMGPTAPGSPVEGTPVAGYTVPPILMVTTGQLAWIQQWYVLVELVNGPLPEAFQISFDLDYLACYPASNWMSVEMAQHLVLSTYARILAHSILICLPEINMGFKCVKT